MSIKAASAATQTATNPVRLRHCFWTRKGRRSRAGVNLVNDATATSAPARAGELRQCQAATRPSVQIGVSWSSDQAAGGHSNSKSSAQRGRPPTAQPIVTVDYPEHIPPHETPLPGVFLANMFQVYPQDRGQNYSVRMANGVAKQILASLGETGS